MSRRTDTRHTSCAGPTIASSTLLTGMSTWSGARCSTACRLENTRRTLRDRHRSDRASVGRRVALIVTRQSLEDVLHDEELRVRAGQRHEALISCQCETATATVHRSNRLLATPRLHESVSTAYAHERSPQSAPDSKRNNGSSQPPGPQSRKARTPYEKYDS